MAWKPEVEYIRYYSDGSAARQPEFFVRKPKTTLPEEQEAPVREIAVDPLAVFGIVMAVVLLAMMVSGMMTLRSEQLKLQQMEAYVASLEAENRQLTGAYEAELDLNEIERQALILGMIPVEDAQHITISVAAPVEEPAVEEVPEEKVSFWVRMETFLEDIFA